MPQVRYKFLFVTLSLFIFFATNATAEEKSEKQAKPLSTKNIAPAEPLKKANVKAAKKKSSKLTIASEDGRNSLTFSLTMQLQFEETYTGLATDEAANEHDYRLRIRRIRPVFKGSVISKKFTYNLHINISPERLELLDFWMQYKFNPNFSARVGITKIPFTTYRINSFKDLQLVDWPIAEIYFGAERMVGFTFHNGMKKAPEFQYEFGIYNGVNTRKSHGVGMGKVSGDSYPYPTNMLEAGSRRMDEIHPAFAAHFAYNHNDIDQGKPTDFTGGAPRLSTGLSAVWDTRPKAYRDFSLRVAPEVLFKAHHFAFSAVGYAGFYERNGKMDETTFGMYGSVFDTSYLIKKKVEISLRHSFLATTDDLRKDAVMYANAKIQSGNLSDSQSDAYQKAGKTISEHEVALGLKAYFLQRRVVLATDIAGLLHERCFKDDVWDFRWRLQLQLVI